MESRTGAVSRNASLIAAISFAASMIGCTDALGPAAEARAYCLEPSEDAGASPTTSPDDLFVLTEAPGLSAEQERRLSLIRSRETSGWVRVAELAEGAGSLLEYGREVKLDVSPSHTFTATGTRVERRAPDDISWAGPLAGDQGWVDLVLTSGGVTGTLSISPMNDVDAAQYRFEPLGGGLQALVCVDVSRFPPD